MRGTARRRAALAAACALGLGLSFFGGVGEPKRGCKYFMETLVQLHPISVPLPTFVTKVADTDRFSLLDSVSTVCLFRRCVGRVITCQNNSGPGAPASSYFRCAHDFSLQLIIWSVFVLATCSGVFLSRVLSSKLHGTAMNHACIRTLGKFGIGSHTVQRWLHAIP